MPLVLDSVMPRAVDSSDRLQQLRERAMLRVVAEERAAGVAAPAAGELPSRRGVLRRFGVLLAGVVPGVAALVNAQAAFAAVPVGARGCAPQYGAPWIEPPTIPYVSTDRLHAAHTGELSNLDRWKPADVVFFSPGGHTGWMGDGISRARTLDFAPPSSDEAYSLVIVGDTTANRAYLLHGGFVVYVRSGDGVTGYKWDNGVFTGMRALASVKWQSSDNLDAAVAALAPKVDTRLVEDRRFEVPPLDLRRPGLEGMFRPKSSISGGSFDHGELHFSVSDWNAETKQSRWAQFTVDVETNKLVKVLLNNKELPL